MKNGYLGVAYRISWEKKKLISCSKFKLPKLSRKTHAISSLGGRDVFVEETRNKISVLKCMRNLDVFNTLSIINGIMDDGRDVVGRLFVSLRARQSWRVIHLDLSHIIGIYKLPVISSEPLREVTGFVRACLLMSLGLAKFFIAWIKNSGL